MLLGPPGTLSPAAVPNENTVLLTVVFAVTPVMFRVNVADWLRNGLCGSFPAIDPPALL